MSYSKYIDWFQKRKYESESQEPQKEVATHVPTHEEIIEKKAERKKEKEKEEEEADMVGIKGHWKLQLRNAIHNKRVIVEFQKQSKIPPSQGNSDLM